MIDAAGHAAEFNLFDYANLWGPTETRDPSRYHPITVLQTVVIPIADVFAMNSDFDVEALTTIQLDISDPTSSAELYFDDLQFVE